MNGVEGSAQGSRPQEFALPMGDKSERRDSEAHVSIRIFQEAGRLHPGVAQALQ